MDSPTHDERLATIETKVDNIAGWVEKIDGRQETMKSQLVGAVADHGARIRGLEGRANLTEETTKKTWAGIIVAVASTVVGALLYFVWSHPLPLP